MRTPSPSSSAIHGTSRTSAQRIFLFSIRKKLLRFDDADDYLIHITTGTHVAQICLFLLTEARWIPGRLVQCSPERDRSAPGTIKIIDLDLSRYDGIASRFQQEQREGASFLKGGIEAQKKRLPSTA